MSWIRPALTWMIRWCLCGNAAATASWARVDFDGLLYGKEGDSEERAGWMGWGAGAVR